jgi:cytochrome c2/sporulation protein YlmC with PRC-barrel domain
MRRTSATLILCTALSCLSTTAVWASCAENLTRIQTALPRAAPDAQTRAGPLVADAEARLKARDAAGCEAATSQALQLLHLPVLPSLQLSTPMAGPQEPARANKPSEPAASAQRASSDPRSGANAVSPPPLGTASPGTISPEALEAARRSAGPGQAANQGSQSAQPGASGQAAQTQPQPQAPATTRNPAQSTASNQPQGPAGQVQGNAQSQASSVSQAGQSATAGAPEIPFFLSSRDLIGTEVVDRENTGRTLGRVASLIIDPITGQTLYVTLEWGGFLGWDRNRVIVPFNVVSFSGRWDRPSLRVAASKIENAPQIREQDIDPLLRDPDWRRAVAQYFGTSPAESAPGAGGDTGLQQASAGPSGPRQPAQGMPASPSNPTGPFSDPKASPGEGATGATAASGDPAAAVTAAATPPPPSGAGGGPDVTRGQAMIQRACAACHTLNQGGPTRVGPNLFGVAERPIASVSGYNYSNALKAHQGSWDQASLDAFLKNPRGYAPGTYMTFPGIRSDQDRQNVVAYLESLK